MQKPFFTIRIPLPNGNEYIVLAKWDGIRNQFGHVIAHCILGLLLSPFVSFILGFGIEGRDGYVNLAGLQGFDLLDLAFRIFGSLVAWTILVVVLETILPVSAGILGFWILII